MSERSYQGATSRSPLRKPDAGGCSGDNNGDIKIIIINNKKKKKKKEEEEEEMFYLMTHSTHFIYAYMASDMW